MAQDSLLFLRNSMEEQRTGQLVAPDDIVESNDTHEIIVLGATWWLKYLR